MRVQVSGRDMQCNAPHAADVQRPPWRSARGSVSRTTPGSRCGSRDPPARPTRRRARPPWTCPSPANAAKRNVHVSAAANARASTPRRRTTSSTMTSEREVAPDRMAAVSSISTMKVERLRATSSWQRKQQRNAVCVSATRQRAACSWGGCARRGLTDAPTLAKTRSTTPTLAAAAGTKDPICASSTSCAHCRRKVLLPPMLGPVTSHTRPSPPSSSSPPPSPPGVTPRLSASARSLGTK